MDRKYILVIIIAVFMLGFVCAKSADVEIQANNPPSPMVTYPEGDFDYLIDYFTWHYITEGSGINTSNCFYELNNVRTPLSNCTPGNISFVSSILDGVYTLVFHVNYSYNSNLTVFYDAPSSVDFKVDTLPPQITITYPLDQTYDYVVDHINYTLNEPNPSACWFSNGISTINSIPCVHGNNTFYFNSTENNNLWTIYANDTHSRENSSSISFLVDTTAPVITFDSSTTSEGNQSQNYIYAKATAFDNYLTTFELNLYRDSVLVSPPSPVTVPFGGGIIEKNPLEGPVTIPYNFTSLIDGNYNLSARAIDSVGHSSQTSRNIVLDSSAPVITIISSPANNEPFELSENNINISFSVDDYSEIQYCSLFINGVVNQTISNTPKATTHIFELNNLGFGKYSWYISCQEDFVPYHKIGNSPNQSFTILDNLTFPSDTNYTDLPSQPDISQVRFYVANPHGMINWTSPLDLSRGLNWANYIGINYNSANVDSINAPELNQPAIITLYNLSWTNPQILKNGAVCSDCTILNYTNESGQWNIIFSVSSFSEYSTREYAPSFSGSSSGGGSRCNTNWTCTNWSECDWGWQTRICVKTIISCREIEPKPIEIQACIIPFIPEPEIVLEEEPEPEITTQETIEDTEKQSLWGITGAVIGIETLKGIGLAAVFVGIVVLIFVAARMKRFNEDQKIKKFLVEVKKNYREKRQKRFI